MVDTGTAQRGVPALRGVRAAFVFLSRIPLGGFPYSAADFRWAPAHFPLVGIVVGAITGALYAAFHFVDPTLAAILAVTLGVLLTGAFHEDGLADSADALGGAHGEKKVLDILKDSRIGTYGAVASILSLGLRIACLSVLGLAAPLWLLWSHTVARTFPVWLLARLRYITGDPAKGSAVSAAGTTQAFVATLWTLGLAATLYAFAELSAIAVGASALLAASVTFLLGRYFVARVGGVTGDFLGATEQVIEGGLLLLGCVLARLVP